MGPMPAGGAPVFAQPWEAQAFALAIHLHERGAFAWSDWAEALGTEIHREDDQAREAGQAGGYYQHWLAALERLVVERRLVGEVELGHRARAWAEAYRSTPHGRPVQLSPSPGADPRDAALA